MGGRDTVRGGCHLAADDDPEARSAPRLIVGSLWPRESQWAGAQRRAMAGSGRTGRPIFGIARRAFDNSRRAGGHAAAVHKGTGTNHVLHPSADARILVL